jgi:hypothetical protein
VGSDGEFMPACEHHFQLVPFDASPMWRRGELSECCVVVARKGVGNPEDVTEVAISSSADVGFAACYITCISAI